MMTDHNLEAYFKLQGDFVLQNRSQNLCYLNAVINSLRAIDSLKTLKVDGSSVWDEVLSKDLYIKPRISYPM